MRRPAAQSQLGSEERIKAPTNWRPTKLTLPLTDSRLGKMLAVSVKGDQRVDPAIAVIECRKISKAFGTDPVVCEISLDLRPGELLALLGPTGSGKSTILRLIAGLEVPDSGRILLDGRPVVGDGPWVPPEKRNVGMVFQDYALFPNITVFQNVAFGLKGMPKDAKSDRVWQTLEMVEMTRLAKRYPYQLSGGEQQRVALARSLAPRPAALLLDEPISNLDPELRVRLRADIKKIIRDSEVSAIYVTHDRAEALYLGDRIAVIHDGTLEQVGAPEEVYHRSKNKFVAQFMGTADFIEGLVTSEGFKTELGVLKPETELPLGTTFDVLIRPDDVNFQPDENGNGRITRRVFQGMYYLYEVALSSGALIRTLQHHTEQYDIGSGVQMGFAQEQDLTCFPKAQTESDVSFQARSPKHGKLPMSRLKG